MFNDQKPPVVTDDEVADFVASLEAEQPLDMIIAEVTDELAYSGKDTTDGAED